MLADFPYFKNKQLWFFLVLLVGIIIKTIYDFKDDMAGLKEDPQDMVLEEIEIRRYNEYGELQWLLEAGKASKLEDGFRLEESPKVIYYNLDNTY